MGYSQSKQSIERVRIILDTALKVNDRVSFPSKHPNKLAYAIREAFAASKAAKDDDHKYVELITKFKLRVKPDRIVFEPRDSISAGDAVVELIESRQALEVPGVTQVLQIVGACIQHKQDLVFPDAKLDESQTDQLVKWMDKNNYEITSTSPLTLMKNGNDRKEDGVAEQG